MMEIILIYIIVGVSVGLLVARIARRMGYAGTPWFFVSLLGSPFLALALLPTLPDRALEQSRQQARKKLEEELARTAPVVKAPPNEQPPDRTIGNLPTL